MNISFLVPCYNEAPEVLSETVLLLKKVLDCSEDIVLYEIIVIDDGSTKYKYEDFDLENVKLLRHRHNKGYSNSLLTGIEHSNHEVIAITDSDGTYPLEQFPKLIKDFDGFDMVIGRRSWSQISIIRVPAKMFLTILASLLAGNKILDLNSGMRIFKKDVALEFKRMFPKRFSFTSTLTMAFICNGYDVKFTEISYHKRRGTSHIHPIKDTLGFLSLILRLTLYFRPLRFFVPLSGICFFLACARGGRDIFAVNAIGGLALVLFFMAFQVFFFGLLAEIINKK